MATNEEILEKWLLENNLNSAEDALKEDIRELMALAREDALKDCDRTPDYDKACYEQGKLEGRKEAEQLYIDAIEEAKLQWSDVPKPENGEDFYKSAGNIVLKIIDEKVKAKFVIGD